MSAVKQALSELRLAEPVSHEGLTVHPLIRASLLGKDYLTLDEALAQNTARVTEVSEGGSVPELLFRNLGDGRFQEVSAQAGPVFALSEVSRGAGFGDLDNDGDSDILVVNNNGPVRLLRNDAPPQYAADFAEIKGQEHVKRALEVAAAGSHNLIMTGPPGSGKTLLARSMPSIVAIASAHTPCWVCGCLARSTMLPLSRPAGPDLSGFDWV